MFPTDLDTLDAAGALALADLVDAAADAAEAARLRVALRWADLHADPDDRLTGSTGPALPGAERMVRSPVDVFPWATGASRKRDLDHTIPYLPPSAGGQPGQTRTDNLGPMSRRSHRAKTHGNWRVWQIHDGAFLWKAPHGHHYLVDQNGTHQVTRASARAPAAT